MMKKFITMVCTSLSAIIVLVAVGTVTPCCPILMYQPELPKRD